MHNTFLRTFISLFVILACICFTASLASAIDISNCTIINTPGTYTLTNNITSSTVTNCIQITSSNVTLDGGGRTIEDTGTLGTSGVYVYNSSQRLSNVVVRQVSLTGWSNGVVFQNVDNSIIENSPAINNNQNSGIQLSNSNYNTVRNNTANTNNFFGILLLGNSHDNLIFQNTVNDQGHGIQLGQYGSPASNNIIRGNTIKYNKNGIDYYGSDNETIEDNTIQYNWIGIYLEGHYNTITRNIITTNGRPGDTADAGIYIMYAHDNLIYNNRFDNYQNFRFGLDPWAYNLWNSWNIDKQAGVNIMGGPYLGGNYWRNYGCTDTNGDYLCDNSYTLEDYNVDNYPLKLFPDQDKDGIADPVDNCISIPNPNQANSDTDNYGDACDNCWYITNDQADTNKNCPAVPYAADPRCGDACELSDVDGDGVPDVNDNCKTTPNPDQADFSDGDGVGDACDNCINISNPNQHNWDSDGLGDACDNCWSVSNPTQTDIDGNCSVYSKPFTFDPHCGDACDECPNDPNKTFPGTCGCGVPDTDFDHDSTPDCIDGCPIDGNKTAPGVCGCGVPDTDLDNDGYLYCNDNCPDIRNDQTDSDGDGIGDYCDSCRDVPNATQQQDTDGDGVGNTCDNCPNAPNGHYPIPGVCATGPDTGKVCQYHFDCGCRVYDGDNCLGWWSCTPMPQRGTCIAGNIGATCAADGACGPGGDCSLNQEDSDGDTIGDACDPDIDSDGIINVSDNCPFAKNPYQTDSDNDGLGNACDNCPHISNIDQYDYDMDGLGNTCDNCPSTPNHDQRDTDHDGTGDACNNYTDGDGDEWAYYLDNCPNKYNPLQEDSNNDGTGDACSIDLRIVGFEVTQVIQDMSNSVPLVNGKPTWVRLYVDIGRVPDNVTVNDVTGVLTGFMPDGSIRAIFPQPHYIIGRKNPDRGKLTDTLNFRLPAGMLLPDSNTMIFNIEVNPGRGIEESDYRNNTLNAGTTTFYSMEPLNVMFVPVQVKINGTYCPEPAWSDFWGEADWLKKAYPINTINVRKSSVIKHDDEPKNYDNGENLMMKLVLRNAFTADPLPDMKYYGLICDGSTSTDFGGLAFTWGDEAWGSPNKEGLTMAHEIGHLYGRKHAPSDTSFANPECTNPDDPDGNYPQYRDENGINYLRSSIGEFGILDRTVYNPYDYYDFMSYCRPRWVSPYTYRALFTEFHWGYPPTVMSVSPLQATSDVMQEYLVVIGTIRADGEVLINLRTLTFPVGTDDESGTGIYSLELQDWMGNILFERNFEMREVHGSDSQYFTEKLPFYPDTAQIILKGSGQVLNIIPVSVNKPVVNVTYPNGGESLSGQQTITWDAYDGDGDPLTFDILYSADRGNTWSVIATGINQANSYLWNTEESPGSNHAQALIRVLATDGVNTAHDDSDSGFTLAKKFPEASIISPRDSDIFYGNEDVILEGFGFDLEDGTLGDGALTWYEGSGIIGTGRQLTLNNLSLGDHNIILEARDSDGFNSFAPVWFTILGKDSDGDGYPDVPGDNCPLEYNPDQTDSDQDGRGDACDDDDSDADGFPDRMDNCDLVPNDQVDLDSDGLGDACDDSDNDGFMDREEITAGSDPLNPASTPELCDGLDNDLDGQADEGFLDTDSDGQADCIDLDDDNDGMPDEWEIANGLEPLANDSGLDPDMDGYVNLKEYQHGSNPIDTLSIPNIVTFNLIKGFNFISATTNTHYIPDSHKFIELMDGSGMKIEKLYRFNRGNGIVEETFVNPDGSIGGDNFPIVAGEGIIIYVTEDMEMEISRNNCPGVSLSAGINWAGAICLPEYTAFSMLQALGHDRVISIQRFNPGDGRLETAGYLNGQVVGMDFPLNSEQLGEGFFIHMKLDIYGLRFKF